MQWEAFIISLWMTFPVLLQNSFTTVTMKKLLSLKKREFKHSFEIPLNEVQQFITSSYPIGTVKKKDLIDFKNLYKHLGRATPLLRWFEIINEANRFVLKCLFVCSYQMIKVHFFEVVVRIKKIGMYRWRKKT